MKHLVMRFLSKYSVRTEGYRGLYFIRGVRSKSVVFTLFRLFDRSDDITSTSVGVTT